MALLSSATKYGQVAAAIHWISAATVVLLLWSGLVLANAADADQARLLVSLHLVLGILLAALTIFRIVWWLALDRYPAPHHGSGRIGIAASRVVHFGLYLVIISLVVTGMRLVLAANAVPLVLSGEAVPEFSPDSISLHGIVSRLLMVLIAGHVSAALYHQFVRRNNLIDRMIP